MNRTSKNLLRLLPIAVLFITAPPAAAAEWGSIKGRFVVDGQPPQLPPLVIDKETFCIENASRKSDKVVVGKNNGLVNALVYVFVGRGGKIDIHPDFAAELKKPVILDNHFCSFHPHVVALRTGQPLVIKNSDPPPVGHNTNAVNLFNETIATGEERTKTIDKVPSPLPIPVTCGIHPFMRGYMLIQDHPYMAVSGEDGAFEIKNVPAGQQEFQFWHETGYLSAVKLSTGATDRRGRAKLKVEPGKTLDLGDIKVPASLLKR
jgi:hypothetical protein